MRIWHALMISLIAAGVLPVWSATANACRHEIRPLSLCWCSIVSIVAGMFFFIWQFFSFKLIENLLLSAFRFKLYRPRWNVKFTATEFHIGKKSIHHLAVSNCMRPCNWSNCGRGTVWTSDEGPSSLRANGLECLAHLNQHVAISLLFYGIKIRSK